MYVAIVLTAAGATWFYLIQRRGRRRAIKGLPTPELAAGNAQPSYQARLAQTDGVLTEAGAADPQAEAETATSDDPVGTAETPDSESAGKSSAD
jgi:hypothetical protein